MKKHDDTTALNLRGVPAALLADLKAAAAYARMPLKTYLFDLLQEHVKELRRKGTLPKGK